MSNFCQYTRNRSFRAGARVLAAAQLVSGVDFADLDGVWHSGNDAFDGAKLMDGKIISTDFPGIGIKPKKIKESAIY